MPDPCYIYRARSERIIDGDTFIARVDLGFATERGQEGISNPIRVRIKDLWAPEIDTVEGKLAAEGLLSFVGDHYNPKRLIIQSYKDTRSMERWVCDVWLEGDSQTIASKMILAQLGTARK